MGNAMKHLYKTFLISILSGSLLMFQMTALAEDTTTGSSGGTTSGSDSSSSSSESTAKKLTSDPTEVKGPVVTDKNGVMTQTSTHKFDKIEDSDMLASIEMVATGFITAMIIKSYKPLTTDVMIAGIGGIAFIAGEVMSNMSFKGKIDAMTVEVTKKSDGTVNEEQMQRLLDLKKSYETARKATKTKRMLQLAAAAAYGLAAIMALFSKKKEESSLESCLTAVKAASLSCANTAEYISQITAYQTARSTPGVNSNSKNAEVVPLQTALLPFPCVPMVIGGITAAGAAAATANVNNVCTPVLTEMMKNQTSTPLVPKISANDKMLQNLLYANQLPAIKQVKPAGIMDSMLNFVFPKAQASWLPLLGLGGDGVDGCDHRPTSRQIHVYADEQDHRIRCPGGDCFFSS